MSRKQKFKPAVAVANRADDPYITSGAGSVQSDKFWRWGDDNLFPNALALMARRSVTHRRIINDKADYISGKGFSCDEGHEPLLAAFIRRVNGDGESLRQVLNKLAFDKALFGNAFLEIVTDAEHSFLAFHHQDASRCRVARDSAHILLHHDWAAFNAAEARTLPLYPAFERQEDGTLRAMIHYKDYEPMFEHYGVPPYIAGFNVSAIAYKTDKWNISRLDNSFQLSGVMMLDSTVDNESEAERIVRLAEQKFAGNPGQVMFVIRDGGEGDNSRFIPIASQNEGDWQALHEQAVSDIVVAHSWFRTLSGLDYASGFSAERILHEYEVALNTVILGEQAELTEPVREAITSILGIDASSLQVINRPPTRSKPIYMKVWEARKADGLDYDPDEIQHTKHRIRPVLRAFRNLPFAASGGTRTLISTTTIMNTLITPAQAVASAFTDGEYLAPEAIGEGDIAAAEQRYIVPVIGRAFHEKLLAGLHAGFTAEYLAAPVALFTRIAVQPRLDIRTGQCGTVAPKSGSYQPADAQSLRELQRSLRRQARTLLRRAAEYLEAHAAEFPEYDPDNNILKRCTTDGNLIQTR